MFKKLLVSKNIDCGLFLIRVAIGSLMLFSHGLGKLSGFSEMFHSFPDPLGISPEASYSLTVFAEFFCSLFLILGLFTRVAAITLSINMAVIAFVMQLHEPWNKKEFAVLFLIPYLTILFTGAGKYSLDYLLFEKNSLDKK